MQANSRLKLVLPTGEKRAVDPIRRPNSEYRKREHLTPAEVAKLIEAAKRNRDGQRDATMILVAYRHGFRASEVCDLEWSAVDFARAEMRVNRKKSGKPSTHPIRGDELRELRKRAGDLRGRLCSRANGAVRSRPIALIGWSSGPARRPICLSRCTHICFGTQPAISWPMTALTRGRFRVISGIGIFGTLCVTPNFRRSPSGTSSATDQPDGPSTDARIE